jgi:hypothetical protein
MKSYKKYLAIILLLSVVQSCELYKIPEVTKPTSGANVDFTKMISIGNSLTAGFMNGALYKAGQSNSYPSTIAKQMALVGGGVFNQAIVESANGCFNGTGGCTLGRLKLKLSSCAAGQPLTAGPAPLANSPADLTAFAAFANKSTLNNFGVPGVTLGGSLSPALAANPYYNRIASSVGTSTLIGDASAALANGGSFFTFWLGNNDILGYATAGGTGTYTPADNSATGFGTLFNAALNAMLAANTNAEGAVANIPDVTSIPYFTTINPLAFNVPTCSRAALGAGIDQLNAAINGWNAGVNANSLLTAAQKAALVRPVLSKKFDVYPMIIFDGALSDASVPTPGGPFVIPKIRNIIASDGILICLSAGSDPSGLPGGMGVSPANPINELAHDKFYLTPTEITEIKGVVGSYNQIISAAVTASSSRLVLVDTNAALTSLSTTEFKINGSSLTASISPPFGGFSLDGVHPNARGSAYIANVFIQAINAKWGSTIPLCNPNEYSSNELPTP